jgi:hypothetical protein
MPSITTDYVVSHRDDCHELQVVAHSVPGIFFPEELRLMGSIAELWGVPANGKYDVTVLITPTKKLGAVHERNGKH